MAEATVTERPATDPATEAEALTTTEDTAASAVVTEGDTPVQTDEATDTAVTEEDPHAIALAAAREAALEEGRELARAELEEERRRSRDTESRQRLKEHFPTTARAMDAELNAMGITDPAERQKVLNHLNNFNLKASEAILAPFEDAVQELLPPAARDEFNRVANGKTAADFQRTFAEFMAEHDPAIKAKVFKGVKLEDLEKATPALKAALSARDAAQFDKGRAKGRTDPAGEAHGEERGTNRSGYRTKTEARNLHARNQISNAQMRAINADPTIPE